MLTTPNTIPTPGKREPQEPKPPTAGRAGQLDIYSLMPAGAPPAQAPAVQAPAAPAQGGGGKLDIYSLIPRPAAQTAPAAAAPQFPRWTEAYREAVQDAAKANNVPVDLLVKALSEGAVPDGQKLESIDPKVYSKNGVLGIYHAANLMSLVLDKVGRTQDGYSKALAEYSNEIHQRMSSGEFVPTALGYMSQIHQATSRSSPTPEEMFTGAMNSAYASDSHPEFPYPSKRPVPPEAAKGVNLLDLHRTILGFNQVVSDLASGSLAPFLPEHEDFGHYIVRAARHLDSTLIADVPARQAGSYDNKIFDILQRGSEAGLKYRASIDEGLGVIGALENAFNTFVHSEPREEYQATTNVAEEADYRIRLREYELAHLRLIDIMAGKTDPSTVSPATKGPLPTDPANLPPMEKLALDATYQTAYDPTNLVGSFAWKGLIRLVEFGLRLRFILHVGPKAIQELAWHPEVIEKFGGAAGERMQRFMANMIAVLGRRFDHKAFAKMVQETAPKLSAFADKTHEMEEEAARIAETNPVKAARLQRQVAKRREILAAPYSLRRMATYKVHPSVGFIQRIGEDWAGHVLARWKAQVGLAELGLRKGFDWLDVFGQGKMAIAKAHAEDRQLATWASQQLNAAFQGLDMKSDKAKELFKALNGGSYDLDDAILKRRIKIYREVMDSIAWLYGDRHVRQDLKLLGFELPDALKNLDRGPRNLLTTEDAILAARAGRIEDPEEAAAILQRAVTRWNYIPFKHLMSSTLRLNPEEAESLFLGGGYQNITGVLLHTPDLRREVEDFFLKERPDLTVHDPEVHAAQSFARVKVAARLLAAKSLAEESEKIAQHFGFSPEEEAWKNLFLDSPRASPIKSSSGIAAHWAQLTQETKVEGDFARKWRKFINLPLVRFFYNPLGHMSNMTMLMLLNKPQLLPRMMEIYLRQIYPDVARAAIHTARRAVKPESRAGQRLIGLAKRFERGRYQDPKLRKFIDTYGTMGRYNGIQDFLSPQEYSVAKSTGEAADWADKNLQSLGLVGKAPGAALRAISAGLNASSMALWPFDEALKSALMEHYVEVEKLPLGRAFARTLAETVDYSDPSVYARAMRYAGWFSTWHTKLPMVMLRLYMQNPVLFAILSRLDPKAFGQTYDYRGQEVERITPVVTAWRDPIGMSRLTAPAKLLLTGAVRVFGGSNPFPDTPAEDLLESFGIPWDIARRLAGGRLRSHAPESAEQVFLREPLLKEYPAPSVRERRWYQTQILEAELGRNINFRRNSLMRMPR